MSIMKLALTIVFLLVAVIMAVLVLSQEGKSNGLSSSIGGGTETYWSKNKGRSKESKLALFTTILAILFFILALVLSLGIF
ncbi:MAG: preprotein translocase subunit SecG [Lachnospiraceae bacterium]|nr:preprotein translocase subunit SecG [Lachnospiraceae bacterium]